jgi:hypothetical protein
MVITDVFGTSPRRRNGDVPIGYLGHALLRRQQCDMTVENQIVERRRRPFLRQRHSKHVSAAINQHPTTKKIKTHPQ